MRLEFLDATRAAEEDTPSAEKVLLDLLGDADALNAEDAAFGAAVLSALEEPQRLKALDALTRARDDVRFTKWDARESDGGFDDVQILEAVCRVLHVDNPHLLVSILGVGAPVVALADYIMPGVVMVPRRHGEALIDELVDLVHADESRVDRAMKVGGLHGKMMMMGFYAATPTQDELAPRTDGAVCWPAEGTLAFTVDEYLQARARGDAHIIVPNYVRPLLGLGARPALVDASARLASAGRGTNVMH